MKLDTRYLDICDAARALLARLDAEADRDATLAHLAVLWGCA